jgi:hypothetical protein
MFALGPGSSPVPPIRTLGAEPLCEWLHRSSASRAPRTDRRCWLEHLTPLRIVVVLVPALGATVVPGQIPLGFSRPSTVILLESQAAGTR